MTNEAVAAILERLCNEARNSAPGASQAEECGALEFGFDRPADTRRPASPATGRGMNGGTMDHAGMGRAGVDRAGMDRAGMDQLLRSLDDLRDLLSPGVAPPAAFEEFDLDRCAAEIIEALNLTAGIRRTNMVLESRQGPLLVTQDRKAIEQLLTRFLDAAFKLARSSGVGVRLGTLGGGHTGGGPPSAHGGEESARGGQQSACRGQHSVRLSLDVGDPGLAVRLTHWLNANPAEAALDAPGAVFFELAVRAAGKRLRALGGAAELERDSPRHPSRNCLVALDLPSQVQVSAGYGDRGSSGDDDRPRPAQPEALQVLVAEDSDESFVLSALLLQNERVWRAHDGAEALSMMRQQRFDMVLMDVHMPGMDGYAAIRGIRDWETQTGNARTPIVVLSADELETQRRSAAQCGCSGFLSKPLRQTDLTTLLDRLKQVRIPAA